MTENTKAAPGNVLRKLFMEPLGLTAYRVAKEIGVTPITLSQILRGRRSISPSVAIRLGIYFGVEPEFWLGLQVHTDLEVESRKKDRPKVTRCAGLEGRSFAIKESKQNGVRKWQVLMVNLGPQG